MTVPLIHFPLSAIVDGALSYLHYIFANPEVTPPEYRWNTDDRQSKIRISAPFVVDNEKPMSAPFIVVERGPFTFSNSTINNVRSADANVFTNMKKVDWMDGPLNIICGSGVAGEASSLAHFVAIMLQADRTGIKETLGFVRDLHYVDISPEIPVFKDTEVKRWEVTLRVQFSLQFAWLKSDMDVTQWNKFSLRTVGEDSVAFSEAGKVKRGESYLIDSTKDFGLLVTNNPQLLEAELDKGWYYIKFADNANDQLYTITEIINNHTLKLQTHDEDDEPVDWVATKSESNLEYDLLWNTIHVHIELPTS